MFLLGPNTVSNTDTVQSLYMYVCVCVYIYLNK